MTVSRPSKAGVLVLIIIALALPLSAPRAAASSLTISGAGATFPAPLIENWTSTYHGSYPNVSISYSAIGSGAGVHAIAQGTVDFAGSDAPLTDLQLQTYPGLTLFPETVGGIAIAYNVPGVASSVSLNLTSDVIVEIYNGTIAYWNDGKVQSLNPSVALPNRAITTIHRSDASGTTYTFTKFLSVTNSWWANNVGFGTFVAWPLLSSGFQTYGDPGVAAAIGGLPASIGYVGLSYAKQSSLGLGALKNSQGGFVAPTLQAIAYAAMNATVVSSATPPDLRQNLVNAAGAGSYPISTYTYIVLWKDMSTDLGATMDKAVALARFLWWAMHDGQAAAPGFFFASLPPAIVGGDETLLRSLTYSGHQLLPPDYLPGVRPGDEATYGSVSASWASNVPPSLFSIPIPPIIQPFLNASGIGLVVETVSGSSVTAAQTLNYPNGTSHTSTITGDLAKDNSSLTPWVVAGGLHPGDHLYGSASGIFGAAMINYTITRVFAGVSRMLNVYNATFIYRGAPVSIAACWDQATGVLVSVDIAFSFSQTVPLFGTFYAKGSGSARLTETNLWSASPSFKLNADNLVWSMNSGSAQVIPLTVSSLGGFRGQVTVVPVAPVGVRVSGANPSTVDVLMNGSATSTLTITVPETTAEGSYSFTVAGSDGNGVSRSLKFTLSVVGDFAVSVRGSLPMVQTGSAVKVFVELFSRGLSGQAGLTVSVSPGGLTAAVANSSLVMSPGTVARTNLTVTADRGITLGSYTVTVTATKGALSHSAVETVTVTAGPGAESTSRSSILGLDPSLFYGIVGGVAVLVAIGVLAWRRRKRTVRGLQAGVLTGAQPPNT